MRKIFLVITVMGLSVLVNSRLTRAQNVTEQTTTTTEVVKPIDVGNKICPVSGQKIDDKTRETYEYKGKIYNLCCKMCLKDFQKDPEKYIKKVDEESEKKAQEEKKVMSAPEMQEGMGEGDH